jgi:hypothetical protein
MIEVYTSKEGRKTHYHAKQEHTKEYPKDMSRDLNTPVPQGGNMFLRGLGFGV